MPLSENFVQRWDHDYELALNLCAQPTSSAREDIDFKTDQTFSLTNRSRPGFYLLRLGNAALSIVEENQLHAVRLCGVNSLIGYGSWYVDETKSYSLRMLTDGKLSFYARDRFQTIRACSPELNLLVDEALINIILLKDQRISALEKTSSQERIGALLEALSKKFGETTENGILINLNLDRLTMAQLSGTTLVNLSRVLTEFEGKGLIKRLGRKIIICDRRVFRPLS